MICRAKFSDIEEMLTGILEFCDDRGLDSNSISEDKVRDTLIDLVGEDHGDVRALVYKEKGKILGGIILQLCENYYNYDTYVTDRAWFTSPKESKIKRLCVAVRLLLEAIKFQVECSADSIQFNMLLDGSAIARVLKSYGFVIKRRTYIREAT